LNRLLSDSVGKAAVTSLLICTVSGIILAVPYQVNAPFDAISRILLDNPAAVFVRNIHFWSAQFFLVFIILHLVDHFMQVTEYRVSRGIWFRLTLSLPVIFFVMISGFILKGDPDGVSAFRILASLIGKIPVIGDLLQTGILGSEDNLELIYVHHIATSTVILFMILFEHTGKVWPSFTGFTTLLFVILLISYFLHPPFGAETGKGPWYFTGFQEILHWFSRPGWAWLIPVLILLIVWALPRVDISVNKKFKVALLLFLLIYGFMTVTALFFRGENWQWKWPWQNESVSGNAVKFYPLTLNLAEDEGFTGAVPLINGRREGCMICHDNVKGLGRSHDPAALGCYSCHGGDPFSLDKGLAHKDMVLIPGNLDDARASCGTGKCHPDIPGRVSRSIMATMSGVVTIDRFVFGETDSLSALAHIREIGYSAADQHLRDLCANCHLGHPKTEYGPVDQLSRGGGCNGCHLNYSDSSSASLASFKSKGSIPGSETFYHPQLNLAITDLHCFGCHSRSGRIATNYEGWHETLLDMDNIPAAGKYRVLDDQRVFEFVSDDVHHKIGMACIDCHNSVELMGDGNLYAHKEEQVKIRCEDCHFTGRRRTLIYEDLDTESKKIIAQRQWKTANISFLTGHSSGLPLVNAWSDSAGNSFMRTKLRDSVFALTPPVPDCSRGKEHVSLSCESCHTAWVPQCIGCHNSYDPATKGFDMLEYKEKMGSWVEYVGRFMAEKPTLGIRVEKDGSEKVITFTPGMILSIDTSSYTENPAGSGPIFHRLFAPVSAHTTTREGRSCKSCHLDPLALGYGRGELVYDVSKEKGKWTFIPKFARNEFDGLPEDAWIGFLDEPSWPHSTRDNTRPFNPAEQKAILTAGACLVCHEEESDVMMRSLEDFPALMKQVSVKCVLPVWQ
jgi:hypothetical protein